MGGRCAQQGQFKTQVAGAHSRDSLKPQVVGAHTPGTVQNMGGRCTQRGQFRTRVVGAHSGDSFGHSRQAACRPSAAGGSRQGRPAHTAGTVQNMGGRCAQQGQFKT
ncbi:unnamed protein product, partial [Staurois parvus]